MAPTDTGDPNQAQIVPHGIDFPSLLSDSGRESILHNLVKFIVDSKSPFSLVKSSCLKTFCTALNLRLDLPSPKTNVRTIYWINEEWVIQYSIFRFIYFPRECMCVFTFGEAQSSCFIITELVRDKNSGSGAFALKFSS